MSISKNLSVAVVATFLSIGTTHAADLDLVEDDVLGWGGFYAGVQVGYGRISDDWTDPALGPPPFGISGTNDQSGIVGGIHVGHNWQRDRIVFGVEADIEASNAGGWGGATFGAPFFSEADLNWQGSVRGRLGYAKNNALFYVTGGVAFANFDFDYNFTPTRSDRYSETVVGGTVGAGLEYKFNADWSMRGEYRYTHFKSSEGSIANCCANFPFRQRHEVDSHTFRVGISRYF